MDDINQLLAVQEDRASKINKACSNFRKTPKQRLTLAYLNTRLESLEKTWELFTANHDRIVAIASNEFKSVSNYFTKDIYEDIEESYITYKSELQSKISESTPQEQANNSSHNSGQTSTNTGNEVKLPTINLPTFSGKYTEWPSFHDLFTSLVDNNKNLDNVKKLHYLKSSLSGEAEQLLRSVTITSDNYSQAWSTLKKRYSNKRYISNSVFKRLFSLKPLTSESAQNIKLLLDTTVECLNLLNNIGIRTDHWDPIMVYLTVSKLDIESHKLWELNSSSESEALPTFDTLKQFMESRFRSLEMIEPSKPSRPEPLRVTKPKSFHTTASADSPKCALCNQSHHLYNCKEFSKKSIKDRYEFVRNANLCFNCFIPNHMVARCGKPTSCRICFKKHHSLLHPEKEDSSTQEADTEEHTTQSTSISTISTHFINQPGQVLLATALVDIIGRNKHTNVYRALIDQGSQASFVTESLVQACGLKRERISGVVSGLSEGKQLRTKYMVQLEIQSRYKPHLVFPINAYVLKTLTSYLPSQETTVCDWPDLENITLADPGYNTPNRIDLLLGAEVYSKIIDNGLKKSPNGVIAQYTHLGWILSGDTHSEQPTKNKHVISMHICTCENDLLRKFWEIENETLTSKRKLSVEEQRCEDIYQQTVTRTNDGRYKVNLPFKEDIQDPVAACGETKQMAINRFMSLERKLCKDSILKEEYTKVINEYLELGHMTLADGNKERAIYLPHRAVVRQDKETSKVRVVFDASAKGSKGCALNDTLLIGPTIQKDLLTLLMKWRKYKIAIVSDIVKMYRQVLVSDEDSDLQCIIWRNHPDESLQFYKLLTVTFGTASAPYLAIRTLFQVAEDEGKKYPLAAEIVKNSFYVDDLTTGCYTIEEGREIYEQTTQLLRCGGFELQKWSSNSAEFLEAISQSSYNNQQPLAIKLDDNMKILGLKWDKQNDDFKFTVNLGEPTTPVTKRNILSDVAKLFDPFGWLSPTIVIAKMLMQKLWLCSSDWDEEVPAQILQEWINFRQQLNHLRDVKINRWIHIQRENTHIELHGFADASISAYAAVIYVKVIHNGQVRISMLESKTKVAPLKQISIARLELCAAVLLARLLSRATEVLDVPKEQVYAYTDSMIVLAWIQSLPMRWQTFVGNRVAEIQTLLANDRWSHVTSEHNPADLASRGVYPAELVDKEMWWNGPSWLATEKSSAQKVQVPETKEEERKQKMKTFNISIEEDPIYTRFSSLTKMVRVLSYCRRMLQLKDKKEVRNQNTKYLNNKELQATLNSLIKIDQEIDFEEEIKDLKEKHKIKLRSKLITLSPYLDDTGLLRVGGRLQGAKVATEFKHPIILSQTSHISWLLVIDTHAKLLHGGYAMLMNYLRSRYWIIGLKQLVKKCARQCVTCIRHKALTPQPPMGNLPEVRVNPGRPFKYAGVDYAGPIQIRATKGRGHRSYKGYICLFICMKTRAVHLEAVTDLTTAGFLAAYRRFTSRRGNCAEIWSDNGLNFVGTSRELTLMLNQAKSSFSQEVAELLANGGTTWHFIPPRAPNFGAIWEAGVKSVKTHLARVVGNSTLTFEEITTLLYQIEACLNSRPLCQMSDHPEDLTPLTPAHFLVGEPLLLVPEQNHKETHLSILDRWRLVQRMTQHFWKRWSAEFLHTLQQRYKWRTKIEPPQIGDLVIIKDEDTPPATWLMAKITKLNPGPDNVVRVATVKTKSSTLTRPLSKLVLLPTEKN
nr:uncharacterized protein LOC117988989 [Maniola hyperantus]